METDYQPKITYYKQRDFGEKINVTFEFIRENYKSLFKIILLIDGPLALMFGFAYAYYMSTVMSTIGTSPGEFRDPSTMMFSSMIMMVVGFALTFSFMAIVVRYLKVYQEMPPKEITVRIVLKSILSDGLWLFLCALMHGMLMFISIFFFVLPSIYVFVVFSLSYTIVIFEKTNPLDSLKRSFALMKGSWWSTFGLLTVLYLIQMAIAMLFIIPFYLYIFAKAFQTTGANPFLQTSIIDTILFSITMTITYLGMFLTYVIGMVAVAFQYFNLREQQEAVGLMSQIDSLDKE